MPQISILWEQIQIICSHFTRIDSHKHILCESLRESFLWFASKFCPWFRKSITLHDYESAHGHLGVEHAQNMGGHLIEHDFTQGYMPQTSILWEQIKIICSHFTRVDLRKHILHELILWFASKFCLWFRKSITLHDYASAHGHLGVEHAQNMGGHLIEHDFTQGHTTVQRQKSSGYMDGRLHVLKRYVLLSQKISICIFSN